jgi:serine/threonine-protein kinase
MTSLDPSMPRSDAWSPPYAAGDVVADKYRVEQLIGSGGMAWVFEATHLMLQKRVALKFMRVDPDADNTEALARFRREARAAACISGEATARVMDVGALDDGSPFLVMEYLEGRDLDTLVAGRTRLPIETAVDYAIQACEGLAETHAAGIVHRDLKPANLFLTQGADGSLRVKLLDFGVAKFDETAGARAGGATESPSVTSAQALVGSPVYMSPEQMRSSRCVDGRTDIWSMGVILYELLALGRSPFKAATLPEICARVLDGTPAPLAPVRPDVPRALEAVILRCLEKDPSRRFQTAAELAGALVPFGPPDAGARADRARRILGDKGAGVRFASRRRATWPRGVRLGVVVAACLGVAVTATMGFRAPDVKAEGNDVRPAAAGVGVTDETPASLEILPPIEVPRSIGPRPLATKVSSRAPFRASSPTAPQSPDTTAVSLEGQPVMEVNCLPLPRTSAAPQSGPGLARVARVASRSRFDIAEFGGRE